MNALIDFFALFYRTYRYAAADAVARPGSYAPPPGILAWWKFHGLAAAILTVGLTTGLAFSTGLNVLALDVPLNTSSQDLLVGAVQDGVSRIVSELTAHRLDRGSIVIAGATLASAGMGLLMSALLAVGTCWRMGRRRFLAQVRKNGYVLGALQIRYAILWLVPAASLVTWRLCVGRTPYGADAYIFLGSNLFVLGGVLIWSLALFRAPSPGIRKTGTRLVLGSVLLTALMVLVLLQLGLFANARFRPTISLTVSPYCDNENCFVYVRLEHAQRIYVDQDVSVPIWAYPATAVPGASRRPTRVMLQFLSASSEGGPLVLEPDKGSIAKAVRVRALCDSAARNVDPTTRPAHSPGWTMVYVPDRDAGDPRAFIDVEVKGTLIQLLRRAEGVRCSDAP